MKRKRTAQSAFLHLCISKDLLDLAGIFWRWRCSLRRTRKHTDSNGDSNSYINFDTDTFNDAETGADAQGRPTPLPRP